MPTQWRRCPRPPLPIAADGRCRSFADARCRWPLPIVADGRCRSLPSVIGGPLRARVLLHTLPSPLPQRLPSQLASRHCKSAARSATPPARRLRWCRWQLPLCHRTSSRAVSLRRRAMPSNSFHYAIAGQCHRTSSPILHVGVESAPTRELKRVWRAQVRRE